MYLKKTHAIACLSGGLGSFLATYLYKQQNPLKTVVGYFTDVKNEDLDTYKFLVEGAAYLGIELIRDCDGRDIWQVFEDQGYQGNTRVPICSLRLKIEQRVEWIRSNCEQGVDMVIGFDWTEIHRIEKALVNEKWANIVAPLSECAKTKQEIYRELVDPPALPGLYKLGFPHSNCGGACVQAGLDQWRLLYTHRKEVFMHAELRQEDIMKRNPNLKPFLRQTKNGRLNYLTIRQFREQIENGGFQQSLDLDFGGCGCAFQ